MSRAVKLLVTVCLCVCLHKVWAQQQTNPARPNIIVILADDLGYGDLSVYGGDTPVPHLQQLANEGLTFTDFHSNGAVCSPTRAALLTGRYQQRMGIEKALSEKDAGLSDQKAREEVTIAEYLKKAGYFTGVIGKWHLGAVPGQSPLDHGFDEFWGMLHGSGDYHSKMTTGGNYDWWHNRTIVKAEKYNTELITMHALDFIDTHKNAPFFLYVAQNAIHFPWQRAEDTAHRKQGVRYNETSGAQNKLGQHSPGEVKEVIADMIKQMDKSVGQIMARLRDLKLDRNTLVFFCSDNGGIVSYEGEYNSISSNRPFRGEKGNVYEGGHRVPAIAWWPGRIAKGTVAETVMTMDITPTILEITNSLTAKEKPVNQFDGISISKLLFQGKPLADRKLYWKHRNLYAARFQQWKLVVNENAAPELYNVNEDLSEQQNLADKFPGIVKEMVAGLEIWKKDIYSKNQEVKD